MSDKSEPKYLVSPGEVVDRIGEIHTLMEDTGLDEDMLANLISDYFPITPEIAAKLEPLGKPAAYWIELERKYQEHREQLSGISRWRKVEDQPPPKDGDAVLCRDPQGLHFLAWWVEDFGQWYDEAEGEYYDELPVEIEWMPIPA